jgi:hypothetical protein
LLHPMLLLPVNIEEPLSSRAHISKTCLPAHSNTPATPFPSRLHSG